MEVNGATIINDLNLTVDQALDSAKEKKLDQVMILGFKNNNPNCHFRFTSKMLHKDALWVLCKEIKELL